MHPRCILAVIAVACWLAGCKITITPLSGGNAESESGSWICSEAEPCVIDLEDTDFEETFVAVPDEGFQFVEWKRAPLYLCGGLKTACTISTKSFAGNPDLEALLDRNDLEFFLEPVFADEDAAGEHTITPKGGTFEFLNGVVLEVPAGAVDAPVRIAVSDLPAAQVDSILSFHTRAVTGKRFAGGFSVTPDVEFNVPITAILPVSDLEPYEYLMQIEVELEDGKYWIEETALEYRPDTQDVSMEVSHFSKFGAAAIEGFDHQTIDGISADPDLNNDFSLGLAAMEGLDGATLDGICTDPDLNNNEICEALDPLQPRACLLKREERPPGTDCCREGSFYVRSQALDFAVNRGSKFCEMLAAAVEVTFHECQAEDGGVPTEVSDLCVLSVNCPEDEFLGAEVTIAPPNTTCLLKGDTLTLQASVVDEDGNDLSSNAVQWRSADRGIATIGPTGIVTAQGTGTAILEARYLRYCKDFSDTTQVSISDLNGPWNVTEVADERDCDEGVNTYHATVLIAQSGGQVNVQGGGLSITGTRSGCSMNLAGGGAEDEGRTFGSGTATIDPGGNAISASGSWTYKEIDPDTGAEYTCSGTSQFSLSR
jgi:hypothetical protein